MSETDPSITPAPTELPAAEPPAKPQTTPAAAEIASSDPEAARPEAPLPPAHPPASGRRPLPTGPLAVWLVIQLAALALAAGRVPLAARYPATGERLSLQVVLVAQIGASALLFPWLLRDLTAAALAVALCWPVLALARTLAGVAASRLALSAGYVTFWLTALAVWRVALPSRRSRHVGAAVAACWVLGGPLLWYLRAEFNAGPAEVPEAGPWYGPILGALEQARAAGSFTPAAKAAWLPVGATLGAGVAVALLVHGIERRRRRSRPAAVALPAAETRPGSGPASAPAR